MVTLSIRVFTILYIYTPNSGSDRRIMNIRDDDTTLDCMYIVDGFEGSTTRKQSREVD